MRELILRALFGGIIVTVFAELGDISKPKRFAGKTHAPADSPPLPNTSYAIKSGPFTP